VAVHVRAGVDVRPRGHVVHEHRARHLDGRAGRDAGGRARRRVLLTLTATTTTPVRAIWAIPVRLREKIADVSTSSLSSVGTPTSLIGCSVGVSPGAAPPPDGATGDQVDGRRAGAGQERDGVGVDDVDHVAAGRAQDRATGRFARL
jgi:hypothetical protein